MTENVKFLLVDDVDENLVALEALLRREGLEIWMARSGTQALELVLTHDFALALLDVQMPEMNGFELAELMRGAQRSRHVPIIFVTAQPEEQRRMFKGYESGAVDFLFKPIDGRILQNKAETFFQLYRQREQLATQLKLLRESEEFRRRVIESSADCIKVLDIDGRLQWMSDVGQKMMEIDDFDAHRNKSWLQLWHGDTRNEARSALLKARDGDCGKFRGLCPTVYGSPKWWDVVISPIHDARGQVVQLLAVSRDMSAQKRVEDTLREREAQLERAVRLREDMLAVVSHDLRNPLGVLATSVALLRRKLPSEVAEQFQKLLATLDRSAQRMERMISDLLDMASIQAGRLSLHQGIHEIGGLAAEVIAIHEGFAREKGIRLSSEVPTPDARIFCDRERILQVFSNLLGNAIKFCPEGAAIAVSARIVDPDVEFSIRDSGPGIAAADLPHVFEPYFSAKPHEAKGTGLGLFISKGILESHGGRIWVASELGQGTTFFFSLPRSLPTTISAQ